jgi:pimeloyl-ACP methyl ester carboxylesterase
VELLKRYVNLSDLRGLSRLALNAAHMVTDVVEDVHVSVAGAAGGRVPLPLNGWPAPTLRRTGGIPGVVYRSIHAGYDVVGAGVHAVLDAVSPRAAAPPASTREREAMVAILNGVWGDHLAASDNPLAIEMSFRHAGVSLVLDADALRASIPRPGRRLLVLVHGLCMSDLGWLQNERHDHGVELARDLGYTPVYLHYNTGLHVSTNGKRFAELLERLVGEWPQEVEELVIIGHSMGGLVARSATHYGSEDGHRWRRQLRRLVFLGTPHHGSRLERAGNWTGLLMKATRFSAPFHRLGATRSAGITDLRHGSLLEEDWQGRDRFGHGVDNRRPLPLPDDVACYTMAVTQGARAGDARDRLLGDGLVPLDSALGIHRDEGRTLPFPKSRCWTGYGMAHLDLLANPEVYAQIREWLAT